MVAGDNWEIMISAELVKELLMDAIFGLGSVITVFESIVKLDDVVLGVVCSIETISLDDAEDVEGVSVESELNIVASGAVLAASVSESIGELDNVVLGVVCSVGKISLDDAEGVEGVSVESELEVLAADAVLAASVSDCEDDGLVVTAEVLFSDVVGTVVGVEVGTIVGVVVVWIVELLRGPENGSLLCLLDDEREWWTASWGFLLWERDFDVELVSVGGVGMTTGGGVVELVVVGATSGRGGVKLVVGGMITSGVVELVVVGATSGGGGVELVVVGGITTEDDVVELVVGGMITSGVVVGVVDLELDVLDVEVNDVELSVKDSEISLRGNGAGGVRNGSSVVVCGAVVVLFVTIMRLICFGK